MLCFPAPQPGVSRVGFAAQGEWTQVWLSNTLSASETLIDLLAAPSYDHILSPINNIPLPSNAIGFFQKKNDNSLYPSPDSFFIWQILLT